MYCIKILYFLFAAKANKDLSIYLSLHLMHRPSSRSGCSLSLSSSPLDAAPRRRWPRPLSLTHGFSRSSTRAFALTNYSRMPFHVRARRKKARPTCLQNRLPARTVLPFRRSAATSAGLSPARMRLVGHAAACVSIKYSLALSALLSLSSLSLTLSNSLQRESLQERMATQLWQTCDY